MTSVLENKLSLHMRAAGLPQPQREYRFHATRRWRFDFAWPDRQLAVECEGGHWSNGRHTRGKGFQDDCEKYNEAAVLGWTVIRVTADMLDDGRALRWIEQCLH